MNSLCIRALDTDCFRSVQIIGCCCLQDNTVDASEFVVVLGGGVHREIIRGNYFFLPG